MVLLAGESHKEGVSGGGAQATLQGLSMKQLLILAQLSWLPALQQPLSPAAAWTRLAQVALQQVHAPFCCIVNCCLGNPERQLQGSVSSHDVCRCDCCRRF